MPEIIVKFAEKIIERVVTEKEHISIGRTTENDIVLDNRGVSRKHAQIEFAEGNALLIDNDSLNGTFVNQRKVTEQPLHDNDVITIGKYDLVFYADAQSSRKMSDMDGTMVLNTKKQKGLVEQDREDKQMANAVGGSILLAVNDPQKTKYSLGQETTTFGKASYVTVPVRGFFVSKLQAQITTDGDSFTIVNLGRTGKTRVNGQPVDNVTIKNGDIIEVGKSVFRFIEG
jgi:pSer/pThr/pTyr-binding forkhead associated (FHA) protein